MNTNHNSTTIQDEIPAVAATKPATIEIPMDPAAKVLACIAELNLDLDTVFERGVLYALLSLGVERRGLTVAIEDMTAELAALRIAVEDIAAVVVANDHKQNQEN